MQARVLAALNTTNVTHVVAIATLNESIHELGRLQQNLQAHEVQIQAVNVSLHQAMAKKNEAERSRAAVVASILKNAGATVTAAQDAAVHAKAEHDHAVMSIPMLEKAHEDALANEANTKELAKIAAERIASYETQYKEMKAKKEQVDESMEATAEQIVQLQVIPC